MILFSCQVDQSKTTGWNYNDPENGGFEKQEWDEYIPKPGLVFVEGGSFTMGQVEQDVLYDWNNRPRKQSVSSFYMDETEVTNIAYREYLYWVDRVFKAEYPEIFKKALPDTLVWRSRLGANEEYVELYLRHPAFQNYPVVGVSWKQATEFCIWRTDRVNEQILINANILQNNPNQIGEDNFNTDAYLARQYEGLVKQDLPSYNPNVESRKVMVEDGILLPRYQLPTEAQWEFAAYSLIGGTVEERIIDRRLYPWKGHYTRNDGEKDMGRFMANFVRAKGDYMGVAGNLNDGGDIPAPVYNYWPNDYGLYCMAGNVNEWVRDVYRPVSLEDGDEFRSFRGNVFKQQVFEDDELAEKDTLGRVPLMNVLDEDPFNRRNYNYSDNINFLDGDYESSINYDTDEANTFKPGTGSDLVYFGGSQEKQYNDMVTLVNDKARVYKGGSWKDRAYWLVPGTRRYLDEDQRTDDIGFRCSMFKPGSPYEFGGN